MNNNIIAIIVILLVVALGGWWLMNRNEEPVEETPVATEETDTDDTTDEEMTQEATDEMEGTDEMSTTVTLAAVTATDMEFQQNGTATLTQTPAGVVVEVNVTGYETEVAQPAHIHAGVCPNPGEVTYPLENVVNGTSTTTLADVTMEQLMAEQLALNVHKSDAEVSVYTACGNLQF